MLWMAEKRIKCGHLFYGIFIESDLKQKGQIVLFAPSLPLRSFL